MLPSGSRTFAQQIADYTRDRGTHQPHRLFAVPFVTSTGLPCYPGGIITERDGYHTTVRIEDETQDVHLHVKDTHTFSLVFDANMRCLTLEAPDGTFKDYGLTDSVDQISATPSGRDVHVDKLPEEQRVIAQLTYRNLLEKVYRRIV